MSQLVRSVNPPGPRWATAIRRLTSLREGRSPLCARSPWTQISCGKGQSRGNAKDRRMRSEPVCLQPERAMSRPGDYRRGLGRTEVRYLPGRWRKGRRPGRDGFRGGLQGVFLPVQRNAGVLRRQDPCRPESRRSGLHDVQQEVTQTAGPTAGAALARAPAASGVCCLLDVLRQFREGCAPAGRKNCMARNRPPIGRSSERSGGFPVIAFILTGDPTTEAECR